MIAPGDRFTLSGTNFLVLDQKDYWTYWTMAELPKPGTVYLIKLTNPQKFVASLPSEWQPPTQQHPHTGLPANVWCGVTIRRPQDLGLAEALLKVRARVRWIEDATSGAKHEMQLLFKFLESWRCSNCGHRGVYRRPPYCPHAMVLCGDAKLDPEVRWLISDSDLSSIYREDVAELGVDVWPEVPIVPGVTT